MEEGTRKTVMIGAVIVCLGVAGIITYKTRPRRHTGVPDYYAKEMIWVKCRNPQCEAEYQINKKEYYEYIDEERSKNPSVLATPPMICKECGMKEVFEATKCEKCGLIFETGLKADDFRDRCPKCGYSTIEVERKKAAEAARRKYGKPAR